MLQLPRQLRGLFCRYALRSYDLFSAGVGFLEASWKQRRIREIRAIRNVMEKFPSPLA